MLKCPACRLRRFAIECCYLPGFANRLCQCRMVNHQCHALSRMKRPSKGEIRADTSLDSARMEKNSHSLVIRAGEQQIEKRVFNLDPVGINQFKVIDVQR